MRLVVGLGNPGERYRRTRHNVGFMVVDALAAAGRAGKGREEQEASVAEAEVAGEPALLVKPLSFMNRSGLPVARLLAAHRAEPRDLVVIVDDVALDLGALRRARARQPRRPQRPAIAHRGAGHRRVPPRPDGSPQGRAARRPGGLRPLQLPAEEILVVQEMVGHAADAVECVLREGAVAAMNRFNGPRKSV